LKERTLDCADDGIAQNLSTPDVIRLFKRTVWEGYAAKVESDEVLFGIATHTQRRALPDTDTILRALLLRDTYVHLADDGNYVYNVFYNPDAPSNESPMLQPLVLEEVARTGKYTIEDGSLMPSVQRRGFDKRSIQHTITCCFGDQ